MTDVTDRTLEELPVVFIACEVLRDMLERLLPHHMADRISFQDYGLHRVPGQMTVTLQEAIGALEESSLVVLGYGLCGNGLQGVRARKHVLLVPRVDDCITLLLGSRQAYAREFSAAPGTYYLSKGWLESGSHPLSEYHEVAERYGRDEAAWIMDQQYQNYERLALVAESRAELEQHRPAAREVAQFCLRWDMRYEEILGSDDYVRRLVAAARVMRQGGLAAAEQLGREFLVIPPGGEIRQDAFAM